MVPEFVGIKRAGKPVGFNPIFFKVFSSAGAIWDDFASLFTGASGVWKAAAQLGTRRLSLWISDSARLLHSGRASGKGGPVGYTRVGPKPCFHPVAGRLERGASGGL